VIAGLGNALRARAERIALALGRGLGRAQAEVLEFPQSYVATDGTRWRRLKVSPPGGNGVCDLAIVRRAKGDRPPKVRLSIQRVGNNASFLGSGAVNVTLDLPALFRLAAAVSLALEELLGAEDVAATGEGDDGGRAA